MTYFKMAATNTSPISYTNFTADVFLYSISVFPGVIRFVDIPTDMNRLFIAFLNIIIYRFKQIC